MVTPLIIRSVGSQRSGFGGSAGSRGESGCRTDSISGVIDIQNVAMSAGSISRWSLAIYVIDIAININLLLIHSWIINFTIAFRGIKCFGMKALPNVMNFIEIT